MKPFSRPLRPEDVGAIMDLTVEGDPETRSMADTQLEGVAALYNILCKREFAYLADEVGMGKTYQALALAAVIWCEKPDARILFISPRENLQDKWHNDYLRFFASNYRRAQGRGDDRVTSALFGEPLHRPARFHNLRSWVPTLATPERTATFLRHTSFTRPVYLTRAQLEDLDTLWPRVEARLRGWGLFQVERPKGLTPEKASRALNLAFAEALNKRLSVESGEAHYFDLVVVDEAQCLRHTDNQRNQVLHEALKGQVSRWLFMSATPAHGGPKDLPAILNHYPGCGEVLDSELVKDLPALQEALQPFMVRRSRRYRTGGPDVQFVGKDRYRHHDHQSWAVHEGDMSALSTLAMGLVQKGLVDVLQRRNNRYRIGFLSSFESLQSSLSSARPLTQQSEQSEAPEGSADGDWHRDQADGVSEPEAPDSQFVYQLVEDFEAQFGLSLAHPKVDSVVDRVAPFAFGNDTEMGGHKFLIFTRRVSTVKTLREGLLRRYHRSVEARIRRCWKVELKWGGPSTHRDGSEVVDDPEAFDATDEICVFRQAMAKGGWLFRFRQTFRASGRNALFFEDGWLFRLCLAGGVAPEVAAAALPDALWAESWLHASRASGRRRRQHRATRLRYLALHAIQRIPEIFGLDASQAAPWRAAYETALYEHLAQQTIPADAAPHPAPDLFTERTLWTEWDERFDGTPLALPASSADEVAGESGEEALLRRQVARTLLGQTFRLTDTVLDLYHADLAGDGRDGAFVHQFMDWLSGSDPAAKRTCKDSVQWLTHLRLIVDSCLEEPGRSWSKLARHENWKELFNPSAVVGVTGGSGGHRMVTRQFRAPSLPRVIVCTDTLKEGVDLHLFCDRVLHYGVAWTPGDLEQRVGRVDRYFSLIERRLHAAASPSEARLVVGYPHVAASLEAAQVERVIERQKRAELLMNSPLATATGESRELVVDGVAPKIKGPELGPFAPRSFPGRGRRIESVSDASVSKRVAHYTRWNGVLHKALRRSGWSVSPSVPRPTAEATLYRGGSGGDCRALEWALDTGLKRYVLTISSPSGPRDDLFTGGERRRLVEGRYRVEHFLRALAPVPGEGSRKMLARRLASALDGAPPIADPTGREKWGPALEKLGLGLPVWRSAHKVEFVVPLGDRKHRITLYAYEWGVRIVGVVSPLAELTHREAWGGSPSADRVRSWALDQTSKLPLGYLAVHPKDGLVFGVHVVHGALSHTERTHLVREIAWRADRWEAALVGDDRR